MKRLPFACTTLLALVAPLAIAVAAPAADAAAPAPVEAAAAPVEDPGPPSTDPNGELENPDTGGLDGGTAEVGPTDVGTSPLIVATGYPIEESKRPITLLEFQSELSINTGFSFNPAVNNSVLRGRFGITRQVQIGLTYNIGGIYDDDGDGPKKITFNPGKSIGVDGTFLLTDWVGVQVTVPVYLDPFAIGLRFGAPMKFHVTDKFTVGGLHDLFDIKLKGFVPSLEREGINEGNAFLVSTNSVTDSGTLRIQGYGTYQYAPKIALTGELGAYFADYSQTDIAYPLRFTAQYTPKADVDVAGTVGFENLDQASSSIGLFVTAKLRI